MARPNIYTELAKKYNKDRALIRKVAHHPFEFMSKVIADDNDHRTIRLRYFGSFFVKPAWRKQMTLTKDKQPPEGEFIYARLLFKYRGINRFFLHTGTVKDGKFYSTQHDIVRPVEDIKYWRLVDDDRIGVKNL